MNFEEMLNARDALSVSSQKTLLGKFYRKQVDKKYRNFIDLDHELTDSIVFCEGIKRCYDASLRMASPQQLHYVLLSDSGGLYGLEIEPGNYQTMAQLVKEQPAIVAASGFIDNVIELLMTYTSQLHQNGILNLCFSPQNIFVRKGDNTPALLCHGSFFTSMSNQHMLYSDYADFVAPEVLSGSATSERSDVYSMGCFIKWLFQQGEMTFEYKPVVEKATKENPDERYASINDMLAVIKKRRALKKSSISAAVAIAITAIVLLLFFELMPQTENIEFVESAPKQEYDEFGEPIHQEYDYDDYLSVDTVDTLEVVDDATMDMYMKKAEEIYRKQFSQQAEKILDGAKGSDLSGLGDQKNTDINSLFNELASKTGITPDRAERIATEEIDRLLSNQRKATKPGYGYQPAEKPENDFNTLKK